MKEHHNLTIDYVGIWNERVPDTAYIKLLRRVLDTNGLQRVKIDAGDLWQPHEKWNIADKLAEDLELRKAVAVINAHTTAFIHWSTPPSAKELKIPLWDGEAHAYGGDWYAAAEHARFNRAYAFGRITKMISWSLITSYHDYLVVPNSGMMKANTPWCGYYEVQPPLWVIAHTTQFAKPGWSYIASACKAHGAGPEFIREGFSVTALKADKTDDYSIVIESMDAKEPQKIKFTLSDDLSKKKLAVWRSVFKKEAFSKMEDIPVSNGAFEITIIPNAIYSLTTTGGQAKGMAQHAVPEKKPFPLPYKSDFENEEQGESGRFFSDQHGTFEVVVNPAGAGKCLKQLMPVQGVQWRKQDVPHTAIGELSWSDYRVSMDVLLPASGSATLWGRVSSFHSSGPHLGYGLEISHDGKWKLMVGKKELKSGLCDITAGRWNAVQLSFAGKEIEALVNGKQLAKVEDATYKNGAVALATGWNTACFDNVAIWK
jgi:galactosylceramidase